MDPTRTEAPGQSNGAAQSAESGIQLLEISEAARDAQMDRARDILGRSRPLEAAAALNNAANIQRALAERAGDPDALIEAVGLYGQALSLAKRWRSPFHWTLIRLNRARCAGVVAEHFGSKKPDAVLRREQIWVGWAYTVAQHWIRIRFGKARTQTMIDYLAFDKERDRKGFDILEGKEWVWRAQPIS